MEHYITLLEIKRMQTIIRIESMRESIPQDPSVHFSLMKNDVLDPADERFF